MSNTLLTQIWNECEHIKGNDLLVFLALADQANDDGYCWPSRKTIAKRARISQRGVTQIIARLEKLGHVKRIMRYSTTGQRSNGYYVYPLAQPCTPPLHDGAPPPCTAVHPEPSLYPSRESKDSPQHANATAGQQGANHASLPMESSLLETDALTDAPAKEPIPLEENTTPDEAPMPEQQAPAEPSPLEEVKPMESGAPEKKARKLTPAQLRSNALLNALGTAPDMATKAEGRRAGQVAGELNTIYKRARGEDMTPEDVAAFVEYVKKQAGGQWTVTANSLLMNGRFAGWMEARAKAAAKPAPVASSAAYDELMSLRGA